MTGDKRISEGIPAKADELRAVRYIINYLINNIYRNYKREVLYAANDD
jgi:hypothetical protein